MGSRGVSAQTKVDDPCRKVIHRNLERLGEQVIDRPYGWLRGLILAFAGGFQSFIAVAKLARYVRGPARPTQDGQGCRCERRYCAVCTIPMLPFSSPQATTLTPCKDRQGCTTTKAGGLHGKRCVPELVSALCGLRYLAN